jgi:hypothetical protein
MLACYSFETAENILVKFSVGSCTKSCVNLIFGLFQSNIISALNVVQFELC